MTRGGSSRPGSDHEMRIPGSLPVYTSRLPRSTPRNAATCWSARESAASIALAGTWINPAESSERSVSNRKRSSSTYVARRRTGPRRSPTTWALRRTFLQRQHCDGLDQCIETEGLLHMELEPRPQNARAVFGTGEGREGRGGCDSAALWWKRPNLPDQPVAALPRHRKVAQEHVGALPLQRGERLLGGTDRGDLGAILREDVGYGLPHVARVVHDQHPDAIDARALIEPSCGTRHVSPPGRHSRD